MIWWSLKKMVRVWGSGFGEEDRRVLYWRIDANVVTLLGMINLDVRACPQPNPINLKP